MILVKCPNCNQKFKAYIQMSKKSFEELTNVQNIEKCLNCKQLVRYTKKDMRYSAADINLQKLPLDLSKSLTN